MNRSKAKKHFLMTAFVSTLILTGCDDSSTEFGTLNNPSNDDPSDSTISFTAIDNCNDGSGIRAIFFETTADLVRTGNTWPGPGQAYEFTGSETFSLACTPSTYACFGAEPASSDGSYWGISLSGSESCEDCCTLCGTSRTTNLNC